MSNTMHPKNAIIKDHDGQIYSVVDILQGNTTALPSETNNGMHPQNAIVMDADGTLHSLVDLLAGAGGGGGVGPTITIDDTTPALNKVYSSQKVQNELDAIIDDATITADSTYSSDKIEEMFSETQRVRTLFYDFTNYVAYGEKGRPAQQGFTEIENGSATVNMVEDIVFGQAQTVIEVNDNAGSGSISGIDKEFSLQDVTDLKTFPSITYGTSKLETVDGGLGFFMGVQDQATGNRYGLTFTANNAPLTITSFGTPNTTFVCDGLDGRPLINIGEWFKWSLKVDAMGQTASFYINGQLTTLQPTFSTGGSGTSRLTVQSGSSSGVDRITRHAEIGIVIMKETLTKTIIESDVNGADVVQIIVPPAPFDLVIVPSPDLLPRHIGAQFYIPLANVDGTITLQGNDNFIVNNLASSTIPVTNNGILTAINRTNNSNDYILSIALEPVIPDFFSYNNTEW